MVRITLDKPYIPIPVPATAIKYGLLYNWYAATDARLITSAGWNIPTKAEYLTLINYVKGAGTNTDAANALKEIGTTYWDTSNGLNTFGFNLKGSGMRYFFLLSGFGNIKSNTALHSTDTIVDFTPCGLYVLDNHGMFTGLQWQPTTGYDERIFGLPLRAIKGSTTLTHGQTGTYTGNDGKVYRTICIGTQEWLADNLCETKYRNGDTIPEVTNNAAWAVS